MLRRERCEPKLSTMKFYLNDLTDSQWDVIKAVLAQERERRHDLRLICNLLLYLLRTGCRWRESPDRGVRWEAVYYYFRKWQATGVIEQLHQHLYEESKEDKACNKAHGGSDGQPIGQDGAGAGSCRL